MDREKILDTRLGMIAIKKGFATRAEIDAAARKQQQVLHEKKIHIFIGNILVSLGIITKEQKEELLSIQQGLLEKLNKGKAPEKSPENGNGLSIEIADDRMTATLFVDETKRTEITLNDIKQIVKNKGIQSGLIEDDRIDEYLKENGSSDRGLVVARGQAPGNSEKPGIEYYFEPGRPASMDAGTGMSVGEWLKQNILPVKKGDLLAEISGPVTSGKGMDVFGTPVSPEPVEENGFLAGENSEISGDGLKLVSQIDGVPRMDNRNRISVLPYRKIEHDVGADSEPMEFDGLVEIDGVIREGFQIQARELVARGIDKGDIRISGDIMVRRGIFGADIHCGGCLLSGYIRSSKVDAANHVMVEKEIFDSSILTNGECLVRGGKIVASQISAKNGIEAMAIGSDKSSACSLIVGIDNRIEKDIEAIEKQVSEHEEALNRLKSQSGEIETEAEENDRQLQESAAEEGAATTRKVTLERKLEDLKGSSDSESLEKAEDAVRQLDSKLKEIQDMVEGLFEKQDRINEKRAAHEHKVSEKEFEIKKLQGQLDFLNQSLKIDSGIPVVKVSREIVSQTEIKGPNAKITTSDSLQGVSITEKKMGQGPSSMRWDMAISNL